MHKIGKDALRKPSSIRSVVSVLALFAAGALGSLWSDTGSASDQSSQLAADGTPLVPLTGHVHGLARARFDVGEAPSSLRMGSLDLVIAKTPDQQAALKQLLADQQNPKSPQYHHWLTPSEYGARFGASDASLAVLSNWLKSMGLKVGQVPAGRGHLPFSGTKAQVEAAFRTPIHLFEVNGERHYSNVSDPMIPVAIKSAVAAIRGLNDFHPRPGVKPFTPVPRGTLSPLGVKTARSVSPDTYYSGSNQYPGYVGPTDFATMYDLLPLYQKGITGVGVTVAIAAQSDIDSSVVATFWSSFGVAGSNFGLPAQQLTSITVPGGSDPGQTKDGNEDEAYLDTEILGALAPGAQLLLVRDHSATTAAQYVVDQNLAAVLNVSFGQCESDEGAGNSVISGIWQQAASEGITVIVSSADAGAASCTAQADLGKANDVNSNGFAVNGLASTPYNLAVGGTDFDPNTESQYWNAANQSGTLASATSHIPEMVWNDSCANPVFAQLLGYDPIVLCNTAKLNNGTNPFILISGGGGGLSSCTSVDNNGACNGGYAQPNWQANVLGITNFGTRAIPDVSMIATRWLMCSYDTTPCDPSKPPTFSPAATGTIKVLDGTSAAAPSVAAILALLDSTQITSAQPDGRQGLINPALYTFAASEYASSTLLSACNASGGAIANAGCVFYDVTAGSNAQPCSVANYSLAPVEQKSLPASTCGHNSGDSTGIMEIGGVQAYAASSGFDIATGLGGIDAANLIATFQASSAPTGLSAKTSGQAVTLMWTADTKATLGYDIYQGTAPGSVVLTPIQKNVIGTSTSVSGLQFAQSYVFAIAAVSSSGISPPSGQVEIMTVPAPPAGLKVAAAGAGVLTLTWTASTGAGGYNIFQGTTSGGEGSAPQQTNWPSTALTLSGLTAGQQYFFTVAAIDTGGSSTPSAEASGTVVPAVPSGLAATAGTDSVSLTWSAAAGAATYNVYQGTTSSGEGTQPVKTGLTSPSVTISGLNAGTPYYFTVAAVNAGGASTSSSQATATPTAPSGGGGGTMDWFVLSVLAFTVLLAPRKKRPCVRAYQRPSL